MTGSVFREGEQGVEHALVGLLRQRGLSVATGESCTGGGVGALVTAVPGASEVFRGALVCYADDVKRSLAGVDEAVLARHGAVSEAVAIALADGARRRLGADLGLGVTGIAGPGGGSRAKPVGTVCIAVVDAGGCEVRSLRLPGDRAGIRLRAARAVLDLARRRVLMGAGPRG